MHKRQYVYELSDIRRYTRKSFNPPVFTAEFSDYEFSQEFEMTYLQVKQCLLRFGTHSFTDEGDFAMEFHNGTSRMISVGLITRTLLNENVLTTLEELIDSLSTAYLVLITAEGPELPLLIVTIMPLITIGFGDRVTLREVGIS